MCRKIPLTLRDRVKNEINKMQQDGIIERVSEPTQWAHLIVIVKKKT